MFLDHTHSIGTVLETAAQAMLNNLDAETLREAVIRPTMIPGVDVIPASIDDGFVASQWESLVAEHLPGFKPLRYSGKPSLTVSLMIMILSLLILALILIHFFSMAWLRVIYFSPLLPRRKLISIQLSNI